MAVTIATWFLSALSAYVALGLLFAPAFVAAGARRVDPAARGGTWGFRVVIFPGVVALWPLLLARWTRGVAEPPEETSAHRAAARATPERSS